MGYGLFEFENKFGKIIFQDGGTWFRYLNLKSEFVENLDIRVSKEPKSIGKKKIAKIHKK